jgi:hypothetical protein
MPDIRVDKYVNGAMVVVIQPGVVTPLMHALNLYAHESIAITSLLNAMNTPHQVKSRIRHPK